MSEDVISNLTFSFLGFFAGIGAAVCWAKMTGRVIVQMVDRRADKRK